MRPATRLALALALLLVSRDGFAQLDLPDDFAAASPFRLTVDRDRTGFLPDASAAQIGIVLDVPRNHKVYRDTVKLSLPATEGVTVRRVSIPAGITEYDPFFDKTLTLLKGRSELTMWVSVDPIPTGPVPLKPVVELQGCSDKVCFAPEKRTVDVTLPPPGQGPVIKPSPEPTPSAGTREDSAFLRILRESGLVVALLTAFGWGVLVSLTPCVWPLIPVVLAVVGATGEGVDWKRGLRLSLLYAAGMALTFGTIGGVIAFATRAAGVTAFLQSPWVVGFVCLFFVALALSMFGVYEIALPAGIAGRLQRRRGSGWLGVLVTGVVSGLVASPCVSAPALALFIGIAATGSVLLGVAAGAVFAFGMGAILVVAGTSARALESLPRSGAWMVSVKHFFGWVMLGVALYFSQMVFGTTVYTLLVGVYLVAAGVFMGATRTLTGETHWLRKLLQVLGILVVVVGVLVFLRGVGPHFGVDLASRETAGTSGKRIDWITSADEGFRRIEAEKRPGIIDFTADWCVYCAKMDRTVLVDPRVVAESRRFVMVKVDLDRDPMADALRRRYDLLGPPAFVFMATDGTVRVVNREMTTNEFLEAMGTTD